MTNNTHTEQQANSESVNIKKIVHILFKRKWMIISFFIGSLMAGVAISYLFSPVYETDAGIFVRLGRENANMPASVIRSELISTDSVMIQLNNEVKLLSSTHLIEHAIDKIGTDQFFSEPETLSEKIIHAAIRFSRFFLESLGLTYPISKKEQLIIKVKKNLEITPQNESRMISVHFFSKNPQLGKKFIETLLDLYVDAHLKAYSYNNEVKLFKKEMQQAFEEWKEAFKRLTSYQQKWGITSPQIEQKELISRISALETALKTIETIDPEKIDRKMVDRLNLLSRAAENPVLSALAMKLIDLEVQLDSIKAQYKPNYKPYRDLEKKIMKLRRRLRQEIDNSDKIAETVLASLKKRLRIVSEKASITKKMKQEVELKRKRYEFLSNKYDEALMLETMNKAKIANVTVTEPPMTQPAPVSPKRLRNILIALSLGLFGGIWIALVYEYLRRTVEFPEDIERLGVPALATFPATDEMKNMSIGSESLFFAIRSCLKGLDRKMVIFTGSHHNEGTSTVIDAFARYLADNKVGRILMLDADLRTNGLTKKYHLSEKPGLYELVIDGATLSEVTFPTDMERLHIMPSGHRITKPGLVCHAPELQEKMDYIKKSYDIVLVDSAPAAIYPDFASFADYCHGIVLVIESESTKIQVVRYTVSRITNVSSKLCGAVINKRKKYIPQCIYKLI